MKRLTLLSSLLCLPTTLACQGDDLSVGGGASLEREDVENLPAGDAEGSDVSGAYLFSGFDQRACSCRSGNVEQWCATTLAVQGVVLCRLHIHHLARPRHHRHTGAGPAAQAHS